MDGKKLRHGVQIISFSPQNTASAILLYVMEVRTEPLNYRQQFRIHPVLKHGILNVTIENDALAFRGLDEFRTGAGSLDYLWERNNTLIGIGIGMLLWTGTTKGLPNLDFGQQYNMTGQFGSEYSHGILSLRLHYDAFMLEFGYDADSIRRGIQDTIHEWIDDGTIPAGTEARNRFFLSLRLNASDWLY